MPPPDPKAVAIAKFAAVSGCAADLDVITRYATDAPLVVDGLMHAIAETAGGGARVCELGFGSAWLLEAIAAGLPAAHLVGLDMSAPATRHAHEMLGARAEIVRGDIDRLPFADAAFDVIATCWTLYFMPDIDAALEEIKRCLRPGGRLIAATVAADNMQEYQSMIDASVREAVRREPESDMGARFDLDTGLPYVERHFARVELREWHGEMALPDAETALAIWRGYGPQLSDPREDAAARVAFERRARARIAREGAFAITRHSGMFVATR